MSYIVFVILLCLGITIVLAGITLICSMNQEKIGFKVLLIGGVMAGVGLVNKCSASSKKYISDNRIIVKGCN